MHVIKLNSTSVIWQNFLKNNESLIIHTPEWKNFIETTFPAVESSYLAVQSEDELKLLLPLFKIKSKLLGSKTISAAFIEYGGFCGESNSDELKQLYEKLIDESKEYEYIEIREGIAKFNAFLTENFKKTTPYLRGITKLTSVDENWMALDKYVRKAVRHATDDGVTVKEIKINDLNEVYALYLKKMREFGSPPFPKSFFENFVKLIVLKNYGKIFGAYHEEKLAALLVGYTYQNRIHIIVNVSDQAKLKHFVNDAVHWHFIKWGCENGFTMFDWGRVRENSGQHKFKKKWGTEFLPLSHYYYLNRGELPNIDPMNKKYELLIAVWHKLPIKVTRIIGPKIREQLGI